MNAPKAEAVLLTGVYGTGKSSVAEEIGYLLEQRGEPHALLDLDYLSWAGTGAEERAAEFGLMLQNLAAVAANYRRAGIRLFVLAYFVRNPDEVQAVRDALGLPLRRAAHGSAAGYRAAAGQRCHQRPAGRSTRGGVIDRGWHRGRRRGHGYQQRTSHRRGSAGSADFPGLVTGRRGLYATRLACQRPWRSDRHRSARMPC